VQWEGIHSPYGLVITHGRHIPVLIHKNVENEQQILTYSTFNILYFQKCGKEASIRYSSFDAHSEGFKHP
jgi:hypothetical protein